MGSTGRSGRGFTLIELLIVIVIIAILAALLLPALMRALCTARSGTASALISQLSQACKAYELDFAVYPPGKGVGSKDMAFYLQKKGARQLQYFEFNPEQLDDGNILNPVWGKDGEPPANWIHYRNNAMMKLPAARGVQGAAPPKSTGSAAPVGAPGQAPILHPNSFDMWCAGCDFDASGGHPTSAWSVKYE